MNLPQCRFPNSGTFFIFQMIFTALRSGPSRFKKELSYTVKYITMKRDKLIDTVKDFPKEIELEDIIERLVFAEKVEKGMAQIKEGKITSHKKLKEIAKKW